MCVSNLAEKNAATRLKFVFFNYNICTHINNCLSEIERKGKETAKKKVHWHSKVVASALKPFSFIILRFNVSSMSLNSLNLTCLVSEVEILGLSACDDLNYITQFLIIIKGLLMYPPNQSNFRIHPVLLLL